jgi:hypothetical protein
MSVLIGIVLGVAGHVDVDERPGLADGGFQLAAVDEPGFELGGGAHGTAEESLSQRFDLRPAGAVDVGGNETGLDRRKRGHLGW